MTNLLTRLTLLISVCFSASLLPLQAQNIIVLGDSAALTDLNMAEQNAYNWAIANYGANRASYMSFTDLAAMGVPEGVTAVWYHTEEPAMPANAAGVTTTLDTFINNGGGLFLSGYGTQLIDDIDANLAGPTEVIGGPRFADAAMGIRRYAGGEMHPIYEGLPESVWPDPNWGGFRCIEDGQMMREPIAWWTGNTFPGTPLGTAPFLPNNVDIVGVGEVSKGMGTIIATSLPGYNWGPATTNGAVPQANLEMYTENVLDYIRAVDPTLLLVADPADMDSVAERVGNGYNWAMENFVDFTGYMSLDSVAVKGIPASVEVIWYYLEDNTVLPASASAAAGNIEAFVDNGGGLLLTGYATQILGDFTGVTPPSEVIGGPRVADPAQGIRPLPGTEVHPIYAGLPESVWPDPNWGGFRTVADGVDMREAIAWWNQNNFPGVSLGTAPFINPDGNIVGVGEICKGNGGIIACSLPGYSWATANPDSSQDNMDLFTSNMINYLRTVGDAQTMTASVQGSTDPIEEGSEDGAVIEVNLGNAVFAASLADSLWTLTNLPAGISYTVARVSDTQAAITLSGTPDDYDDLISDFTITIDASQVINLCESQLESVGEVQFQGLVESGITGLANLNVVVSPNPANRELTLKIEGTPASEVSFQLMDTQGRIVQKLNSASLSTISLPTLSNGLYIYQVSTDKGQAIGKVFIQQN